MAKIATASNSKTSAPAAKKSNSSAQNQNEIEQLAYQFFVERGYEHGHDREDWLRAEAIVKNRRLS